MRGLDEETRLLPVRWQVLSGSWLKVMAMVAMLIDHTTGQILGHYEAFREPLFVVGRHVVNWYFLLRCVGRLAFPLFCFLMVEGFLHTHDRKKYGRNLLVFALLSEIPWNLTHGGHLYGSSQSVMFTLLLGYLALVVVERWERDLMTTERMTLSVFSLIAAGILLRADYGNYGVSFILLLYVLRRNHVLRAAVGCCFLGSRWIAGLAFIPIGMYNGRRGFIRGTLSKYLFYTFYPLHLLLLYLIKRWLGM